jgi:membrane protein required for beta-lactamase induction
VLPRVRDIVATVLAVVAMGLAVWPLRAMEPGLPTLVLSIVAGGLAFGAVAIIADVADLRAKISARLQQRKPANQPM